MAALDNVTTDDLRQVLAKVVGKKPSQRLMAAINDLEDDDLIQKEVAGRYGYTGGCLSRWFDRLERLGDESFEQVVYDEPRSGRPLSCPTRSTISSSMRFTNRRGKSVLTRPPGLREDRRA